MSEVWRIFTAVDLTQEIRDRMSETAELLQNAGWEARWVPQDRMHMTVRFFGDTAVETIEKLQDELRPRLAAQPAFELHVSRVGAFPAPNRPRVIWLGIDDPFGQIPNLKAAVEDASVAAGLEAEPGPYKPHLTVGRLQPKFRISGDEAVETFQEFGRYEPLTWIPDSVNLVRSKLARGGAQHTVIEKFPFGPPDGTISEDEHEDEDQTDVAGAAGSAENLEFDSDDTDEDSERNP
jgi:RNA 2',3'-cyclic 3'-phosphodiesterase